MKGPPASSAEAVGRKLWIAEARLTPGLHRGPQARIR